jgi:hypothetical protein
MSKCKGPEVRNIEETCAFAEKEGNGKVGTRQ